MSDAYDISFSNPVYDHTPGRGATGDVADLPQGGLYDEPSLAFHADMPP